MKIRDILAIIFLTAVAFFLIYSAIFMLQDDYHPFGEPVKTEMDQYIIDNTQNETGSDNGVTSVVFDYRGFDTLGEATVLFTAVAGVILVFRRLKK